MIGMLSKKDFDKWNIEKQEINLSIHHEFYVNIREIWFTKMGLNVGFEENGKKEFRRPVLVIKKVGNLFFTVAMTSKGKQNHRFYHKLKTVYFNENNQKYKNSSYCILSQVRVMDKKRFIENMGYVLEEEFIQIKEKLKAILL